MTREESIEIIQKLIGRFKSDSRTYKALEMAIQALSQEPTSEKELNKAYTFGHNKGVKAYYNEQLCTVELPEAVFEYILSLVPTEETEQEPCDDAVSRKKAIWVISACDGKSAQIEALEQLPPVTQKSAKDYLDIADRKAKKIKDALTDNPQKSGKWHRKYDRIVNDLFWECDKCGCGYQHEYIYCPNCGAKMESEDKE